MSTLIVLPTVANDSRTGDIINTLLGSIPTQFPSIQHIRTYVNTPLTTTLPSFSGCDNSSIDSSLQYAITTKSLANHITTIIDTQCIHFYDTNTQDKSHFAIDLLIRE